MRLFFIISLFLIRCYADIYINNAPVVLDKKILSWVEIKDKNVTKQRYDYSCGSASLSTILKYYYNIDVSEREILDAILLSKGIDINKKETIEINEELRKKANLSFLDLADYAIQKGFRGLGLALDLESLAKLKAPVIIYVNVRDNEHFTVYKGMDSHFVYLADPSFGNIKVSIGKFKEMFYQRKDLTYPGKILALIPDEDNITIQEDFMKVQQNTQFTDEIIKEKTIR